ncbi:hypothetical protein KAM448_40270 [Aeromonas caviae]|uniref:RNA helicase n=1 Tax=Aeromonas caviae TaxID=648 RepID=A0ABD0BD98_AERCA|nr:hypothetical protein [Aeromonas caviae]GJA83593.1 hypothetical protein KAM355_41530 [Aeromonas caviae]GJB13650.1 hypothetical protein KAM362_42100 [Aeromonas caviae]GJB26357.1 hypothetical protein KAM365_41070 [Aeromonas caviae]GJB35039.1 hypothetical protein KAM367_41410 [Aeromonas caviae]GJB61605.1 hypothetical protein KAM374_41410 [Aeromonas caviae]
MTERKKTGADKLEQNTKVEVAQTNVVEANTQPITCGLIMPIASNEVGSAEHWRQVRTIIEDAIQETGLKTKMVSESDEVNVIHQNIVANIYSNDIVICDVSSRNPNVMFELGMRLTFDKPVVIIKDRETPFSFDVGNIQHLEYPRSLNYIEIQQFQRDLREKVLSTLDVSKSQGYSPFLSHYKIKHVAKVDTETVERDDFIISSLNELKNSINLINRRLNDRNRIKVSSGSSLGTLNSDSLMLSAKVNFDVAVEYIFNSLHERYGDDLINQDVPSLCEEFISSVYGKKIIGEAELKKLIDLSASKIYEKLL